MKPEVCQKCPALKERGPVNSSTCQRPRAIIVGEAPGDQECTQGRPFYEYAPAGGMLWSRLRHLGVSRDQLHIMNVAKCITKHPLAFKYCWENFGSKELEALPKDIPIIALGNEAARVLVPAVATRGILTLRGTRFGRVFFVLHPSYIHRSRMAGDSEKQDLTPTLEYDLANALDQMPKPEMQIAGDIHKMRVDGLI